MHNVIQDDEDAILLLGLTLIVLLNRTQSKNVQRKRIQSAQNKNTIKTHE